MKFGPVKYGRPQDVPTPYGRPQDRMMRTGGTIQEEADETGTISAFFKNLYSALTSNETLPKRSVCLSRSTVGIRLRLWR